MKVLKCHPDKIKSGNRKKEAITAIFLFVIPLLSISLSCTKLDTKVYDQTTILNQTAEQIDAVVGSVYSGLRNFAPCNDVYCLSEVSTDEIIVPKRGLDWNDTEKWEEMWKHSWGPNNDIISNGWIFIYSGIARVNSILQVLEKSDPKPVNSASIYAAMTIVRAFYYYLALDLFGNIPIVEMNITDLSKLANKPRAQVFDFVEKELKDNLPDLPKEVNSQTYGRATHWFAQAILAKLYLNAEVYTGVARWSECIEACDAILNSNKYGLEGNFFDNFIISNEGSIENIFVIPFDINAGLIPFWVQAATLHYNSSETYGFQFYPGGFNGFCSSAEYYNLFDPADFRRQMFLVGQQYVNQIHDSNHLQKDRSNHLLIFDPVITSFSIEDPKTETAGARCAKWEFNKQGGGLMSNDFAVYRLADIILMKAEAQFRSGNITGALTTINQKIDNVSIRNRAYLPDFNASEMNLDGLLKERARELSWEGFRRNDLVRFGHFTNSRIPEKGVSANFRTLYPIPESALAKNPYLVQNTGY